MVPIFEEKADGAVGYAFPDFQTRFLDICSQHRASRRALAFAFLLFDVDTPELIKMLRDPDYWKALDQVSGRYLSVFTLMTHEPRSSYKHEYRGMVGVAPVPDPGMKLQLILNSYFGLDEKVNLPAVLFFQVNGGKISGYCLLQLRADGIEVAFNELRAILRDLADALAKSEARGHPGPAATLKAVKARLRRRKALQLVKDGKKVLDNLTEIAELAGILT